jgi:hypothetical protein
MLARKPALPNVQSASKSSPQNEVFLTVNEDTLLLGILGLYPKFGQNTSIEGCIPSISQLKEVVNHATEKK